MSRTMQRSLPLWRHRAAARAFNVPTRALGARSEAWFQLPCEHALAQSHAKRTASSSSSSHPVSSRVREVDAACAALADSIYAGDLQWFDRIAQQLHAIATQQAVQGQGHQRQVPSAQAGGTPWSGAHERSTRDGKELDAGINIAGAVERAADDQQEDHWKHALEAIEQVGKLSEVSSDMQAAYGSEPYKHSPSPAADHNERSDDRVHWGRDGTILESSPAEEPAENQAKVSVNGLDANYDLHHEHAGEDERVLRYEKLLNHKESKEDRAKRTRMDRYVELLREADSTGRAAPGAALPAGGPVRFKAPAASPQPQTRVHRSAATSTSTPPTAQVPSSLPKEAKQREETLQQAVGRGKLRPSVPNVESEERVEDQTLRKEDFVWSEHEFNQGDKENKRVLRGFKAKFKEMAAETPEGLRSPTLLTAALDLALACVKCYELDKADAIYRRVIGECRRRGMPWDVKCIQDLATLRCKQHRQADAAELLEELANKAPPHPATFINLGTVYNQLKFFDKAEAWFLQAVNLKGGTPEREDLWNLGIVKKNKKMYDEALPMLEKALEEFQVHEPHHPVTIAKLHSTLGGCLHEMARHSDAVQQYSKACSLYVETVGEMSPLHCSASEGLAKALKAEHKHLDAFDALIKALNVHAGGDAVHPTPLFENLELALSLHDLDAAVDLERLLPVIDTGIANLERRGMAEDGNAGLVMSRGGKVLWKAIEAGAVDAQRLTERACELLQQGAKLIRRSHDAKEADLMHEIIEADSLRRKLQQGVASPISTGSIHSPAREQRLSY